MSSQSTTSRFGDKCCPECGSMSPTGEDGVSDCPTCGCTFVARSTVNVIKAEMASDRAERNGGLMASAGIPPMYWTVEPDEVAAGKIRETGKGFYFQGGNGTYKTLKACSIARAYLESGKSVKFVSSAMLMSEFRDAMGDRSEHRVFAELYQADLLVIDDLGKENASEWTVSMLFNVIDGRYGHMRPVVVTSNYSRGELASRLASSGDKSAASAIASRLAEMTVKVDFGNDDRRIA